MTENAGFADEDRINADQTQEIDPSGTDAREPAAQFEADQAQEIDLAGDEGVEPGDPPRAGG